LVIIIDSDILILMSCFPILATVHVKTVKTLYLIRVFYNCVHFRVPLGPTHWSSSFSCGLMFSCGLLSKLFLRDFHGAGCCCSCSAGIFHWVLHDGWRSCRQ